MNTWMTRTTHALIVPAVLAFATEAAGQSFNVISLDGLGGPRAPTGSTNGDGSWAS